MASQLSVKVYLVENKTTKEVRRFAIDESVASNFEYVVEKIRQVFPDLTRKQINVFWKGMFTKEACFFFIVFVNCIHGELF